MRRLVRGFPVLLLIVGLGAAWQSVAHTQAPRHAVLITLDGVRTEEIFGGLDRAVFASTIKDGVLEESAAYRRYSALTPEERREKVMPFFWGTLMRAHGSIAGNRARGSRFSVTNRHRFSYPGYAEILTGAAHDDTIDSNENRRYPYPTVLEFLRARLELPREKVAVFASWETFNWIAEHEEGALTINAGYEMFETADPVVSALNTVQFDAKTPWDSARHDAFTFALAMHYLRTERPRVLYVAFDETDDWAHDKRYDRVLDSLARTDAQLKMLWTWLQGDPEYRDNTVLIITVDHGRGHTSDDWSTHGQRVERADETWMAAIGPDWPRRGEWTTAPAAYTSQIAATLAKALGQDFRAAAPDAGAPIDYLWER
jgi:hypothetical protein